VPYTLFYPRNERIENCAQSDAVPAGTAMIWCDLNAPTKDEEHWVESLLGIEIPTREEMHEIEPSSRLYVENGVIYCTANLVTKTDTPEPENHAVSFILSHNTLVTLRYSEPYSFANFSKRLLAYYPAESRGIGVLMGLIEAIINRLADVIEGSGHTLDDLIRVSFRPSLTDKQKSQHSLPDFEGLLREIGVQGDLLSKVRESLLSLSRMLAFLNTTAAFRADSGSMDQSASIQKDISALLDQSDSLSGKVAFLLDAALGMVSIQQTAIIKIFSVAAVIFLPPTLVASIYGMNFDVMPELGWKLGYPLAIVLMGISAWLPFRLFKKKKWL